MIPLRDWVFRSRHCLLGRHSRTGHLLAYTELPRTSELWPLRYTFLNFRIPGTSSEVSLAGLLPDQSHPGFWFGLDWAHQRDKLPSTAHLDLEAFVTHLLNLEKEIRLAAQTRNHAE